MSNTIPMRRLDTKDLGLYVSQNFQALSFNAARVTEFNNFRQSKVMAPILNDLKAGLDDISCIYIDRFERILDLCRADNSVLVPRDFLWTDIDRYLLSRYERMKHDPNMPNFLRMVDKEWGSSYTNYYGLFDHHMPYLKELDGKAIIDAGGFIGDTLFVLRDLFNSSVIHTFEPNSRHVEQIHAHAKSEIESGMTQVNHMALGHKKCKMKFETGPKGPDGSAAPFEKVQYTTIDDYVAEQNIKSVGVIKMDCSGSEVDIMHGAMQTIVRDKPLLLISIYHNPDEFYLLKTTLINLNLGYKFKIRRAAFSDPLSKLVLIAWQ